MPGLHCTGRGDHAGIEVGSYMVIPKKDVKSYHFLHRLLPVPPRNKDGFVDKPLFGIRI